MILRCVGPAQASLWNSRLIESTIQWHLHWICDSLLKLIPKSEFLNISTKSCFTHTLLSQWIVASFFELVQPKTLESSLISLFVTHPSSKLSTTFFDPPCEIYQEPDPISPPAATVIQATSFSRLVCCNSLLRGLLSCSSKVCSQHSSWDDGFLIKPRLRLSST